MKSTVRTLSQNGQIAIPRRFLEALGLTLPTKVQVIQEGNEVIIRKGHLSRMSDEAFTIFLDRIRHRNRHVSQNQVAESIHQVRKSR